MNIETSHGTITCQTSSAEFINQDKKKPTLILGHSKAINPDLTTNIKTLIKHGLHNGVKGKILNKEALSYTLANIPIDKLEPLEQQRDTSNTWAVKRLISEGGLDMAAFGVLFVQKTDDDPIYRVFDGCGRLLMAQLMGLDEVPCLIFNISKDRASYYFAYMQSNGRRSLNQEIIFANRVTAGELLALAHESWLKTHGLRVNAANGLDIGDSVGPSVRYRTVQKANKYSPEEISQVKSWIRSAWPNETYIKEDIFLGMLLFVRTTPASLKNGLNKAITQFFAVNMPQNHVNSSSVKWKHAGGNCHNQEAQSVAYGFWKAFSSSAPAKKVTGITNLVKVSNFKPKKLDKTNEFDDDIDE